MAKMRPYSIAFAGFDPSAGAGLLADIKTMEQNGGYGMGVCTALTIQNDIDFEQCQWTSIQTIIDQYRCLSKRFHFECAKIGLIKDLKTTQEILFILKKDNPSIKVVWDPILKASAGFDFNNISKTKKFEAICAQMTLITPNIPEAQNLFGDDLSTSHLLAHSQKFSILLKGGHSSQKGVDILYDKGKVLNIDTNKGILNNKHGSGCILSSAICTQLSHRHNIIDACTKGKQYIEQVLASNNTLLGYHKLS